MRGFVLDITSFFESYDSLAQVHYTTISLAGL